jgi:hypothetical protein
MGSSSTESQPVFLSWQGWERMGVLSSHHPADRPHHNRSGEALHVTLPTILLQLLMGFVLVDRLQQAESGYSEQDKYDKDVRHGFLILAKWLSCGRVPDSTGN